MLRVADRKAGDFCLVHLLNARASSDSRGVAFRYKSLGSWKSVTWGRYAELVQGLALTLELWGVGAGGRVVSVGEARPEMLITDMAVQSVGAAVVCLPSGSPIELVRAAIEVHRCSVVVVDDYKTLGHVKAMLEGIGRIIVVGDLPTDYYKDDRIVRFAEATQPTATGGASYGNLIAVRNPSEVAVVCVAGTASGDPQFVSLTSESVATAWESFSGSLTDVVGPRRVLSCISLSESAARCMLIYFPLFGDHIAHLPEQQRLVGQAVKDIKPEILLHTPDFWDAMASEVGSLMESSGLIARQVFGGVVRSAAQRNRSRLGYFLARSIRKRLGLSEVRLAISSGTRGIRPESRDLIWGLNVNLAEMYSPAAIVGFAGYRLGGSASAGFRMMDQLEVRVGDDSMLLLRGPQVASLLPVPQGGSDAQGWMPTGSLVTEVLPDGELLFGDSRD